MPAALYSELCCCNTWKYFPQNPIGRRKRPFSFEAHITIRLLTPDAQRPFNAITTFDASVEAGLIAAGKASADLTGGVRYFAPSAGLALRSK